MALDSTLNFNFTEAQQTAITDGFDAIFAVLNDASVPPVYLTKKERQSPSIGNTRLPYVHNAVDNVLTLFPDLVSRSIPLTRTITLMDLMAFVAVVKPRLEELNERFTDLSINAENIVYLSMRDSYKAAQQQEGRMAGADVLVDTIAPLFEKQGRRNVGPDAPGNGGDSSPANSDSAPATDTEDDDTPSES